MRFIESRECMCIDRMGSLTIPGQKYICKFYTLSFDTETVDIKWDTHFTIRTVIKFEAMSEVGPVEVKLYLASEFKGDRKEDLYENAWPFEDYFITMDEYRKQKLDDLGI